MDDLQALQREAMKRVADCIADVQDELTRAQEEMMRDYFADPDPMPVFVFQAKDKGALSAIASYYSWCLINGSREHSNEVQKAMHDFRDWQTRNPEQMKMPDKQHVPLPRNALGHIHVTPDIPDDFPHGKVPEYCNWCPDPNNPNPTYHTTGAAHTVRTGPNSFAINVPPVHGRPIRDNPQA